MFQLMFSFYVFEYWWELLQEGNRYARKPYRAEGVRRVPGLPAPLSLTGRWRSVEGWKDCNAST